MLRPALTEVKPEHLVASIPAAHCRDNGQSLADFERQKLLVSNG